MPDRPYASPSIGSGPAGFYAADALLKAEPPVEVDMYRPPAHAVGPRPARRRARPSGDQGRLARVRRIAARPGLPLRRQRRGRRARLARRTAAHYHAVIYAVGAPDRPPSRHPGRGAARLARRHRVRRLVQRPPRLRRTHVRPARRARGHRRQRQRRARRRPHAVARPRTSWPRPTRPITAIEALAARRSARSSSSARRGPAQAAFTNPGADGLGELAGADILVDPAELRARRGERGLVAESDTTAGRTWSARASSPRASRAGKPQRIVLRFLVSPVAIRATSGRSGGDRPQRAGGRRARRRARRRDRRARVDRRRARLPQRRLPRRGARGRPVRRAPRDDHATRTAASSATARRSQASTARAGSSAARPA